MEIWLFAVSHVWTYSYVHVCCFVPYFIFYYPKSTNSSCDWWHLWFQHNSIFKGRNGGICPFFCYGFYWRTTPGLVQWQSWCCLGNWGCFGMWPFFPSLKKDSCTGKLLEWLLWHVDSSLFAKWCWHGNFTLQEVKESGDSQWSRSEHFNFPNDSTKAPSLMHTPFISSWKERKDGQHTANIWAQS